MLFAQLGRSVGKAKPDANVGGVAHASKWLPARCKVPAGIPPTTSKLTYLPMLQAELERQQKYPNLPDPHKLKSLLVSDVPAKRLAADSLLPPLSCLPTHHGPLRAGGPP
jgi:hypothetical protein